MLSKKTAGRAMIEDEEKYIADSLEAVSLPALMFTGVMSYDDAIGQARALTDQGNVIRSANTHYHLTPPNDRASNGLKDLVGDVIILNDWHYADIKRAISENTHLQFRNIRVASNINLKTFNHLKEAERENLSIFKELYKERPAPIN